MLTSIAIFIDSVLEITLKINAESSLPGPNSCALYNTIWHQFVFLPKSLSAFIFVCLDI